MRVFFMSVTTIVVLAIGAMFTLHQLVQRNTDDSFTSSPSVRLPDHGNTHNLVGRDWYSPKEHGWADEIPTSNSKSSLAK